MPVVNQHICKIFLFSMTLLVAGCSSLGKNEQFLLSHNGELASEQIKKYFFSILSDKPKVVIAKPTPQIKAKTIEVRGKGDKLPVIYNASAYQHVSDQNPIMMLAGNSKASQVSPYEGAVVPSGATTIPIAAPAGFANKNANPNAQKRIVTPVATTVHGEAVMVIKSVNGGSGILLLKKGVEQNKLACKAFFDTMPNRTSDQIEQAANSGFGLFRPTYWLDRRPAAPNNNQKMQLAAATNNTPPIWTATIDSPTDGQKSKDKCESKLAHYNYEVSHALIERLGLLSQRGPFFAAWRDDGAKAMVLNMSLFNNELDFNEAVETWMKLIVRHPDLWEMGQVHDASLRQQLRHILNKGGKSIFSLFVPSGVQAQPK